MGLGSEIRDLEKAHPGSGSWIQGSKKNLIPDPDPQHWWLKKLSVVEASG
jgi:hypothetical protein